MSGNGRQTHELIESGGLKLSAPWNTVTIEPSGATKTDTSNTQVLTYNLWLSDFNSKEFDELGPPSSQQLSAAPIAKVLLSLRDALIDGAKASGGEPQQCFTNYNPLKPAADAGNTFKLALSFVRDSTTGLTIKVGVIELSSTMEWKSTTGNTLTVAFVQRGLATLQLARDAVDTECKYPKSIKDKACRDAVTAYEELAGDTGLGVSTPQ